MDHKSDLSHRIRPGPNLTEQVTGLLKREITGGKYEKGGGLPSEQSLSLNFGVSRSVIREAVSRLKADGLVISRQGRGAFVASTIGQQSFQISGDSADDYGGIFKIIQLRTGVEVEAAGLAATNRDAEHLREMRNALDALARAVSEGAVSQGVEADLLFHQTICAATNNPHFAAFFTFLSPFLREAIAVTRRNSQERLGRIGDVELEHKAIYDGINAGDPDAARSAARRHVANTMNRLKASGSPSPAS